MASADATSTSATGGIDYYKQAQPKQTMDTPSVLTAAGVDSGQASNPTPAKSLFGPYPLSENQNEPAHGQTMDSSGSAPAPLPVPVSADQIGPSKDIQQSTDRSPQDHTAPGPEISPPAPTTQTSDAPNPSAPPLTREKTIPAIGPATDKPTPLPKETETEGPLLYITLLLSSTGARHPFKLDAKYLKKRNVVVDNNNPINISLYKLKELILRDWREEWEAKPSSPESIRLISMGKLLNDKARLCDSGFTNGTTPHIMHMTIKPQDIVDEEDAKMKAAGGIRGENERSPGCRCIIQ